MAKSTYLDDLINYKHNVIGRIAASKEIVGLLLNDPDVDMESDAAYDIVGNNIYDYDYVDHTVERADAYIMVDSEMIYPTSGTMNKWYVYVQVVCEKSYNPLNHRIFKGVKGNRRDNLAREIDLLINGTYDFGIGPMELRTVNTAAVPDAFTSVLLTYEVHDYRRERNKKLK